MDESHPTATLDWYSTDLKDDFDAYIAEAMKDPEYAEAYRWACLTRLQQARELRVARTSRLAWRRARRRPGPVDRDRPSMRLMRRADAAYDRGHHIYGSLMPLGYPTPF